MEDKSSCGEAEIKCDELFDTCNLSVVLPSREEISIVLPEESPVTDILKKLSSVLKVSESRVCVLEEKSKEEIEVDLGDTAGAFCEAYPKVIAKAGPALLFSRITPQYLLVNRKTCFESLLKLLETRETDNLSKVWNWIKELPYHNEQISGDLQNLKTIKEIRLKYFNLNNNDIPKALYAIYVLTQIVIPADLENDECKENFIQRGGYDLAETVFVNALNIKKRTNLVVKLILHALNLMNCLLNKNNVKALVAEPEKIWNEVLELTKWCLANSEDNEAAERVLTEEEGGQIVSNSVRFHTLLALGHSEKLSLQVTSKDYMNLLQNGNLTFLTLGMFHEKNPQIRKEIADWLYTIWDIFVSNKETRAAPAFYESLMGEYSTRAMKQPEVSNEYYTLVAQIEVISLCEV